MNSTTLTGGEIKVITYVYIACLIPSVIGSFSVIVVSLLRWKNLQEQRLLLVQLALADLLASGTLLASTAPNLSEKPPESSLCKYGIPLSLVFYDLSFILVLCYAQKSKNILCGWRSTPTDCEDVQSRKEKDKLKYILLWLIHIILYLVYALALVLVQSEDTKSKSCNECILFSLALKDNQKIYMSIYSVLFTVAGGVVLFCAVIYHKMLKSYEDQQQQAFFPLEGDAQSRKKFKHLLSTALKMFVVIICWTPALVLFVLVIIEPETATTPLYPLYILQAVSVSLQGFLNSIVYTWRRPNFTSAVLGEHTPLITYNHTSFFEESLKSTF